MTAAANFLYPWLLPVWKRLICQQQQSSLPHALLINGPRGVGKAVLAQQLTALLLCRDKAKNRACGACKSCHLLAAGSHANLLAVGPKEDSKVIKVDQVRQVIHFASQTAQLDGYKVILINPADTLNINAANALLKILEEPGETTLFILVTEQPGRLPATIRSRCQQLAIALPAPEEAIQWLQQQALDNDYDPALLLNLAGGAPLLALQWGQGDFMARRAKLFDGVAALQQGKRSAVELAQDWQGDDLLAILDWLDLYLADLIKLSLTGNSGWLKNPDQEKFLLHLVKQVAADRLYLYKDQVQEARRGLLSGSNPNKILLLEDILLKWERCISG